MTRFARSLQPKGKRYRLAFLVHPSFLKGLLALAAAAIIALISIKHIRAPGVALQEGDVARQTVRAPGKLTLVDAEATRRRKEAAKQKIRDVFDFKANLGDEIAKGIHRAFQEARAALAQADAEAPAIPPEKPRRLTQEQSAEEHADGTTIVATGEQRERSRAKGVDGDHQPSSPSRSTTGSKGPSAVEGTSMQRHPPLDELGKIFQKELNIKVTPELLKSLIDAKFNPKLEKALTSSVRDLMAPMIIQDKRMLPDNLSTLGITLRELSGTRFRERTLRDASSILVLQEVQAHVGSWIQEHYPTLSESEAQAAKVLLVSLLQPNLSANPRETAIRKREASDEVDDITLELKKGTVIVREGDQVSRTQERWLKEASEIWSKYSPTNVFLSMTFVVFVFLVSTYLFAATYIRKFSTSIKDLTTCILVLITLTGLARLSLETAGVWAAHSTSIEAGSYYFGIPIASGAIIVRILMNSETAIVFAVVISALVAMIIDNNAFLFVYFFVSSVVAAGAVAHTRERVHILRGGLIAAGCNILVVVSAYALQTNMLDISPASGTNQLSYQILFAFLGGVGSAILALGFIPILESLGYVTDYKLLELANLNHPLLKELMVSAPGTYHHSVIVGNLSEAASQAIGANALLARVGCYYHDIGKMKRPEYFIENLRNPAENRHDRLPPQVSAHIIAGHVREGIELARRHKLPQAIIDLIPQHHGTALISFFLNKARQSSTTAEPINEADFRYPGPKPQTREAGIVMLADATEASTRSIKQVNPAKIQINLRKIFQRIINDGQLDECPLTLRDLAVVQESFFKTLMGIYHNRIEYPVEYQASTALAEQSTGAVLFTAPANRTREASPLPLSQGSIGQVRDVRTTDEYNMAATYDPLPGEQRPTPAESERTHDAHTLSEPSPAGAASSSVMDADPSRRAETDLAVPAAEGRTSPPIDGDPDGIPEGKTQEAAPGSGTPNGRTSNTSSLSVDGVPPEEEGEESNPESRATPTSNIGKTEGGGPP